MLILMLTNTGFEPVHRKSPEQWPASTAYSSLIGAPGLEPRLYYLFKFYITILIIIYIIIIHIKNNHIDILNPNTIQTKNVIKKADVKYGKIKYTHANIIIKKQNANK